MIAVVSIVIFSCGYIFFYVFNMTSIAFCLGVPQGGQWILELVDYFGGGFIIYVLVIIETMAIMYIYG